MVLATIAAFLVNRVVTVKTGTLLTTCGTTLLLKRVVPSRSQCICRLVIGLLAILWGPLRATLVLTVRRVLKTLAWAGPTFMPLMIKLEFGATVFVIS